MASFSPESRRGKFTATATRKSLEACWKLDVDWTMYPSKIQEGCEQVAKALSVPPTAVLSCLLLLVSFFASHSAVVVEGTDWVEPVILWLTVVMPTGSGKSSVFRYVLKLLGMARKNCALPPNAPSWTLDEATFEKMGALMDENYGRLLGVYDELTTFLTQINLYKKGGVADSHDLPVFLQLYNGHPWSRKTVTGDANFVMEKTSLTVGGFTQPTVANAIITMQGSVEKGLAQRFLWVFPKPVFGGFATLEPVDTDFSDKLVQLLTTLWIPGRTSTTPCRTWKMENTCKTYTNRYDAIQKQLGLICGRDELLSGLLSKAKGQILRVAAAMHILFCLERPGNIPQTISEEAISAAINFVHVCCEHASLITGRSLVSEEIDTADKGESHFDKREEEKMCHHTLLLPGRNLYLTPLLEKKKFRGKGNKEGALVAFRMLQDAGLGELQTVPSTKQLLFRKRAVPQEDDARAELRSKLMKFDVSLRAFEQSLAQDEITGSMEPQLVLATRHSPRKQQ